VQLEVGEEGAGKSTAASFNSILVQLEASPLYPVLKFDIRFNSILVQLEASGGSGTSRHGYGVSIPYWCN